MALRPALPWRWRAVIVWRIEASSARILATHYPQPANPLAVSVAQGDAANGQRLARLDGCTDCHGKALTGHTEFSGLFGIAACGAEPDRPCPPSQRTAQLAAAIRYGVKPDGTSMIRMPVGEFLRSSDGDIAAIIAYLRSLPQKPGTAGKTHWAFGGRAMLAMGLLPLEAKPRRPRRPRPAARRRQNRWRADTI